MLIYSPRRHMRRREPHGSGAFGASPGPVPSGRNEPAPLRAVRLHPPTVQMEGRDVSGLVTEYLGDSTR